MPTTKKAKASEAKALRLYSITVSGQGDTFISLVTKEIWNWIGDPIGKPVPQDVRDYHVKEEKEEDWEPNISKGTAVNDAALQAAPAKVNGKRAFFTDMRSFTKFVQKHNVKIVDEWKGYIY